MNENLVFENVVQKYNYKYYSVESVCDVDTLGSIKRYGIKIESYDTNNNLIDTKTVADIFGSKEKMIKGINVLKKLEVTPITLEDVIVDNIY